MKLAISYLLKVPIRCSFIVLFPGFEQMFKKKEVYCKGIFIIQMFTSQIFTVSKYMFECF